MRSRALSHGVARAARTATATLAALAVPACLAALACGEEPPPAAPVVRPVKLLTIHGAGLSGSLEYPGQIAAAQHSEMAFEVPGKIINFLVSEGQLVEVGQLLARLDPRDYEAEVEKDQANLRKTKTDLDRYQILYDKGVNPLSDLDGAKRRYEVVVAHARVSEKALQDTYLRANFAGVIARKLVQDFSNVQAKQPVLVLQDDSTLEIKVTVPERDIALASRGGTLEERTARARPMVSISSAPSHLFPARFTELSTTADPVTRTYEATLAFDKPEGVTVLPGMTAKVSVTVAGQDVPDAGVAVPARAVLSDDTGQSFVWRVDPAAMTVARAPVVVGQLSGADIQVRSGLEDGDVIAISGVHQLREGLKVRPFEP